MFLFWINIYKENKAYYNNMGFQNNEIIESNPPAFAIKRLVDESILLMSGVSPASSLQQSLKKHHQNY
jgi:hypothetical protein